MEIKKRQWHEFIEDMMEACEKVLTETKDMDKETFLSNKEIYHNTLKNIETMGLSAFYLPPVILDMHPRVSWRQLMAIGYAVKESKSLWGIEDAVIWSIIQETIPELLPTLHKVSKKNNIFS